MTTPLPKPAYPPSELVPGMGGVLGALYTEEQMLAYKKYYREIIPMTDKNIQAWWSQENGLEDCDMCKLEDFSKVVRAVEKHHGITPQGDVT